MGNTFAVDIIKAATDIAIKLGPDIPWEPIAEGINAEREANKNDIALWRDKWRVLCFGRDAGAAVADMTREFTKKIIGINATWVDDDLRVLAHLADIAVQEGLTGGLNTHCLEAIEKLKTERRAHERIED